jgi:3D (Asp-Asp-Asp) domain-containing protein
LTQRLVGLLARGGNNPGEIAVGDGSVWVTLFEFPLTRIDAKTNAVAADFRVLPKGTYLYVPGYSDRFVPVDSPGGVIIRRSTAKGIVQFDVKFKSFRQAKQWGSRWLDIEVIDKE